jgi:hypothetical protein
MANPLKGAPVGGGGGHLEVGEVRTVVDRNTGKVIEIVRTTRDYVYDLADAYNAAMSGAARERGLEWYVNPAGELKLGDNASWARAHTKNIERCNEAERARFLRHQLAQLPEAAE